MARPAASYRAARRGRAREEEARIEALRAAGKMRRLRVINDARVLGSIEWPTGWVGGNALCFRLAGGEQVSFAYSVYQINEERDPVICIDKGDAGYFTLEVFVDLPSEWADRVSEFPGWQAVRPTRVIDLGAFPV
jgi:hypothetical protein